MEVVTSSSKIHQRNIECDFELKLGFMLCLTNYVPFPNKLCVRMCSESESWQCILKIIKTYLESQINNTVNYRNLRKLGCANNPMVLRSRWRLFWEDLLFHLFGHLRKQQVLLKGLILTSKLFFFSTLFTNERHESKWWSTCRDWIITIKRKGRIMERGRKVTSI